MLNGLKPLSRSLRWGMVGGGGTSQIGYSHRCAALRDNVYTLLAGALDVDAERGRAFGEQLGSAATPTTRPCFVKRRSALTGSRSSRSPPRIIPISPSPKRRWKRASTSSVKSPSVLPPKRRANWWT